MSLRPITRTVHRGFAGFMALWLSGALFLICCVDMRGQAFEAEFPPLAKPAASHCDKARKNDDTSPRHATPARDTSVDCCGFLSAVFDKSRKVEKGQKIAVLAQEPAQPRPIRALAVDHSPLVAVYTQRLPNLQRSFIQNCVFLI